MSPNRGHSSNTHPDLERAPGDRDNWVEASGGLPPYVKRIAKHIRADSGLSTSRAIASAISQVKRWARGGEDVTPATRAKAVKAVAQWEALKARNRARSTSLSVPAGDAVASFQTTTSTGGNTVPVTSSTDGPRTTHAAATAPAAVVPRTHADLRRAIRAAGDQAPPEVRRRLVRRARQINALPLIPSGWLNLSQPAGMSVVELAARNGQHIPGTDYNWKHGYIPLNARTALANRKGYWVTPNGKKVSAARTRKALGVKSNAAAKRKLKNDPKARAQMREKVTGSSSSSAPSPTDRQTLRPSTTPTRGLTPGQRAEVSERAAAQRAANAPGAAPSEVSPDMGRQQVPRGAAANAGPVESRPVRNRPRPQVFDSRGRRMDKPAEGGRKVTAEENARARESFNQSRRGWPVKGGEATANNTFEVTKRNDGRFYLNDTRTGERVMGPTSKKAAMAERDKRGQRAEGEDKPAAGGHVVRRSSNGREWHVYDDKGNRVAGLDSPTLQGAQTNVDRMLETRRMMAAEGAPRQEPELVPANGNPRFRMQKVSGTKFEVLDTSTGKTSLRMNESDAERKMNADNTAYRKKLAKTAAGRREIRERAGLEPLPSTRQQAPTAARTPTARSTGNDTGTVKVPATKENGALFGVPPAAKAEQKARVAALPKGWTDANPTLGAAAKLARGNEIRRVEDDMTMSIRAKADGSGYTWTVSQTTPERRLERDADGRGTSYVTVPVTDQLNEGESPTLADALRDTAREYTEETGEKLKTSAADLKRFADTKPPKLTEGMRAAGATPPVVRSDAERRRQRIERMSADQRKAHMADLKLRQNAARSDKRTDRSAEAARYGRLWREAAEIDRKMSEEEYFRKYGRGEESKPAVASRPKPKRKPKAAPESAPAASDEPLTPETFTSRRVRLSDFEARDLVPQEVKDMARARQGSAPQPNMAALGAANLRLDRAQRNRYVSNVASPGSYTPEQKLDAEREAVAAARAAEQARLKYARQAAMEPAVDSTHKTPRSAVTAARKRNERDGRPVYMVATGDGTEVRLTGTKPRSGPYAELTRGKNWGVYSGSPTQTMPQRDDSPTISDLRPKKVDDQTFTKQTDAESAARRVHGIDGRNAYLIAEPGGKVRVSDRKPESDRTEYAIYFGQPKLTHYPTGRRGIPSQTAMNNLRLGPPPQAAPTSTARPTTPAVDPNVDRARRSYVEMQYNLSPKDFRNAGEVGNRAFDALLQGRNNQTLSILRQGAQALRDKPNRLGSDVKEAERIDKVAAAVEKKLRKPKNAGAALIATGPAEPSRAGVRRPVVDHMGREWELFLQPEKGTVRATSGRLSGERKFKKGDQQAAVKAAQQLVGEMSGNLSQGRERRIRTNADGTPNVSDWNAREADRAAFSRNQSEYERLRLMDDTTQTDDNRAIAVVNARIAARNSARSKHGVGLIPDTSGHNAKGRVTGRYMDDQEGLWSMEYDPDARVFWVKGPNGRAGSARLESGIPLQTHHVSSLVSDLLEGKRRKIRNSDQLRSGPGPAQRKAQQEAQEQQAREEAARERDAARPSRPTRNPNESRSDYIKRLRAYRDAIPPQNREEYRQADEDLFEEYRLDGIEADERKRAERKRTDPYRETDAEAARDAREAVEAGNPAWAVRIMDSRLDYGTRDIDHDERAELRHWGQLARAELAGDWGTYASLVMGRARQMDEQDGNIAGALEQMRGLLSKLPAGHERVDRVERLIGMLERKLNQ